jgi:predicted  nucleic acid-binding Zn-ribbon protein
VLNLNQTDLSRIHEKLDTLISITSDQERHLKNLNGTIARHEINLNETRVRIEQNKSSIDKAKGAISVIGLFSLGLSIIVCLKTIGFL